MPFGQEVGSLKRLKESLKGIGPIRFIPRDGRLMVRFLEEPNKWVKYFEVFDPVKNVGWPVPEDESAPGYPDPDMRKTKRYLCNAVDTERDEVIALQLPASLVNDLAVRFERYDTLMDREYELFRSGTGLDTSYGLTPEPASKKNMAKYKALDLEDCLQQAYDLVWGDSNGIEEEDEPPPPRRAATKTASKATKATKKAAPKPEPTTQELGLAADHGDEKAAVKLTEMADDLGIDPDDYNTWASLADALEGGLEDAGSDDEEDEPVEAEDEEEDEPSEDPGDGDTYTEEELESMQIAELRVLARENGIVTRNLAKPQIIAALMGK
jgi:hypothetical protein